MHHASYPGGRYRHPREECNKHETASKCHQHRHVERLRQSDNLSLTAPFGIKTTEAPHYHRVIWQREHTAPTNQVLRASQSRTRLRAPRSVNDGNGFVFVDHLGHVCPSGFLPVSRGNVRTDDLVAIYRNDEVFQRLRDPDQLMGRCQRCEFRAICGGSRARAFAGTGSLVAADPLCAYDPGPDIRPMIPIPIQ
jgi:AdoMet-dependent heme synthase